MSHSEIGGSFFPIYVNYIMGARKVGKGLYFLGSLSVANIFRLTAAEAAGENVICLYHLAELTMRFGIPVDPVVGFQNVADSVVWATEHIAVSGNADFCPWGKATVVTVVTLIRIVADDFVESDVIRRITKASFISLIL